MDRRLAIIGAVRKDGMGEMQWQATMPFGPSKHRAMIARSDDFNKGKLSLQWQWNYQPREGYYSLTERPGWLRLKAFRTLRPNQLLYAGNTLTQRTFRTLRSEVTLKMDLSGLAEGQRAGLCHFSKDNAAIGVVCKHDTIRLEYRHGQEITAGPVVPKGCIWLQSNWELDGVSQFLYSIDGKLFQAFGDPYQLQWGNYRGDRIGIYTFNDETDSGYIDVDYLRYEMQ